MAVVTLDGLPCEGLGLVPGAVRPGRPRGRRLASPLPAPSPTTPSGARPRVVPGKARLGVDVDRPLSLVASGVADVPIVGTIARAAAIPTRGLPRGPTPGRPGEPPAPNSRGSAMPAAACLTGGGQRAEANSCGPSSGEWTTCGYTLARKRCCYKGDRKPSSRRLHGVLLATLPRSRAVANQGSWMCSQDRISRGQAFVSKSV